VLCAVLSTGFHTHPHEQPTFDACLVCLCSEAELRMLRGEATVGEDDTSSWAAAGELHLPLREPAAVGLPARLGAPLPALLPLPNHLSACRTTDAGDSDSEEEEEEEEEERGGSRGGQGRTGSTLGARPAAAGVWSRQGVRGAAGTLAGRQLAPGQVVGSMDDGEEDGPSGSSVDGGGDTRSEDGAVSMGGSEGAGDSDDSAF
jgi:hypothetical protein